MITINNKLSISLDYTYKNCKKEDLLFFDIETTGFSPENTVLYLIGCIYYEDNCFKSMQWFADDRNSEYNMLISFFEFMKKFKVLIHFNGNGFDIPYISKKCKKYNLDYNFNSINSIDIYKLIYPYKKIFHLENYKQKSIERFFDIKREDKYNGGELIHLYSTYLKSRINDIDNGFESSTTRHLLDILLLHNADDIKGLLSISSIISYIDFFGSEFEIIDTTIEQSEITIITRFETYLPKKITYTNSAIFFAADENIAIFKFPLYTGELKFFYDNYNDYYYLPEEDTAIHKSIALYVDKDFKTKAKAANCYTRKSGMFLAQFSTIFNPYFKKSYKDKISYIEITDDMLKDNSFINEYIHHILNSCIDKKTSKEL